MRDYDDGEDIRELLATEEAEAPTNDIQLSLVYETVKRSRALGTRRVGLSLGAKFLLCELIGLAQEEGYAFARNGYLSKEFGVGVRQIKKYLKVLRDSELILIMTSDGKRKIYIRYSSILPATKREEPMRRTKRPGQYDVSEVLDMDEED